MSAPTERLRSPGQRAERAGRILDAAADLLLRHGYRRVTIDDVAAGAGIGKGTVYLHWKTREQLFGVVFARELLSAVDELRLELRRDPRAGLLHRFARAYFLAIVRRPLLRGFLLGDPEMLGRLTAAPGTARDARHAATLAGYLRLLSEHGLLRDDMDADEVGHAYQATFEGFLRAGDAPGDAAGDAASVDGPERRADLLARTVQRAFESDAPASDAALAEVAAATAALLGDLIDADRAEFDIPEL
ncbi:TetR/AcrR family transcriptional regulator [Actinomadura roseirufa]|uniref:TetR/AcrR family transcriptional regulator n=1 Tax=Actinomadura roseirufa TaxID=2094049 RepID=UPI0010414357|nr:TetR/AcrR family transcriptional regulator [Actinomadura roseirufa]